VTNMAMFWTMIMMTIIVFSRIGRSQSCRPFSSLSIYLSVAVFDPVLLLQDPDLTMQLRERPDQTN
jgi:hypothetical protein